MAFQCFTFLFFVLFYYYYFPYNIGFPIPYNIILFYCLSITLFQFPLLYFVFLLIRCFPITSFTLFNSSLTSLRTNLLLFNLLNLLITLFYHYLPHLTNITTIFAFSLQFFFFVSVFLLLIRSFNNFGKINGG